MTTVKMVKLGTLIKPAKLQKCGNDDYPVLSMTMHNGLVFQSDKFKKSVASQDKSTYKVVHRNQLVIGFPIDAADHRCRNCKPCLWHLGC